MSYRNIKNTDEIIAKSNIVNIVSKRIALNSQNKACCPFHEEKTPSFTVTPAKNVYFCHGACKTGGNAFTFIRNYEQVDAGTAWEMLATESGVIPIYDQSYKPDPNRIDRKDIYNALSLATIHFQENLLEQAKYLYDRGFTDAMIEKYQLGYAKGNTVAKVAEERFLIAGDILRKPAETSKSKTPYNPFRGRIIIPLHDMTGKVVGFTGREIQGKKDTAKYLNSHETQLFSKGSLLYGYHFANNLLRPNKNAALYILEGQLKTIANLEAGYPTVSAGGTGFTDRQAELIEMLTKGKHDIFICQDRDEAGTISTIKILSKLRTRGLIPKVGVLNQNTITSSGDKVNRPDLKDTDDFMKEKLPIDWIRMHWIDWILWRYNYKQNDAESAKIVNDVIIPIIQSTPNSLIYNADLKYLKEKTNISMDILNSNAKFQPPVLQNQQSTEIDKSMSSENLLFAFLIQDHATRPDLIYAGLYDNTILWFLYPLDIIKKLQRIYYYKHLMQFYKLPMSQIIAEHASNNQQLNYWLTCKLPDNLKLSELHNNIIKKYNK